MPLGAVIGSNIYMYENLKYGLKKKIPTTRATTAVRQHNQDQSRAFLQKNTLSGSPESVQALFLCHDILDAGP